MNSRESTASGMITGITRALWTTALAFPAANFLYQLITRGDYSLAFDRSFHQVAVIGWIAFLTWRASRGRS